MKNSSSILNFIYPVLTKAADLLVQSHLIIALATFFMCLETFIFLGEDLMIDYATIAASGAIVFYGIHRLFQIRKYKNIQSERIEKLKKYSRLNLISILFFGLVFTYYFIQSNLYSHWKILFVFVLSGFYLFPLLPDKNRIRDLPYIKIFIISLFWMLITAYLPFILSESKINPCIILYLAERFLFILFITIPFDIRDIKDDRLIGLKTMATTWGYRNVKRTGLFIGMMGITTILACHILKGISLSFFIALLISYIFSFIFFFFSSPRAPNNYYSVMIDGLMILRYFIILIVI